MDRTFWPAVAALVVGFILFRLTGIDLWLQDHFYDFTKHVWLVDAEAPPPRLFFYSGPKLVIWVLGLAMVLTAFFHPKLPFAWMPQRRDLWVAVLTLAIGPALVGLGKKTTDVYCPYQVVRYGGKAPYRKVLERFPEGQHPNGRGHGFPAGHASGGFALMAVAGLFRRRRHRIAAILGAQTIGWTMGLYQMFKGAHYLSHTVVTCLLCWIIFLTVRRLLGLSPLSADDTPAALPAESRAAH